MSRWRAAMLSAVSMLRFFGFELVNFFPFFSVGNNCICFFAILSPEQVMLSIPMRHF
jgi:hypothetical protein